VVGFWKRALKGLIAPKTTAVRSYVYRTYCIGTYMYVPSESESELCVWQKFLPGREGGLYNTDLHNTHQRRGGRGRVPMNFIKICINRTFLCVFSTIFMPFSSIFTALFFPYIAHQRTAQILILSVCSSLFFFLSAIAPKMQVRSWAKSRAVRIPLWNRSSKMEFGNESLKSPKMGKLNIDTLIIPQGL